MGSEQKINTNILDGSNNSLISFILKIDLNRENCTASNNLKKNERRISFPNCELSFSENTSFIETLANNSLFYFIGDVINLDEIKKNIINYHFTPDKLLKIRGNFYLIEIDTKNDLINVYNSLFGILPVYYYTGGNKIIISSSLNAIEATTEEDLIINKNFIIQQTLFYYPLFEDTIFKGIKSLGGNKYLTVNKRGLKTLYHLNIENYFVDSPIDKSLALESHSDLFIETIKKYFPKEKTAISFTGGFDSRTLVACAQHFSSNFFSYSLGAKNAADLTVPFQISKAKGIDFRPIYLDSEDYLNRFVTNGINLINCTGLGSNLLYNHFFYSAEILSCDANFVMDGFFGSELFRALDIRGALTSHELVDYFEFDDEIKWINSIRNSSKLKILNTTLYNYEIEDLIDSLISYKKKYDRTLSLNRKIYIYLFEEVFRKVFGFIITGKFKYVNVRTPYLDFDFVVELLKTELAGVYNRFFAKNPIYRYKGQLLYAHILKKTSKELYSAVTGKGYSPANLISPHGKLKVGYNYFNKHFNKKIKHETLDNLGLISGLRKHQDHFGDILSSYYNNVVLNAFMKGDGIMHDIGERDLLLLALSTSLFLIEHGKK